MYISHVCVVQNIAQLKAAILRETTKEHYMGESVPTVYLNFEQEIIK